jgi:hypothetical protein
MRITRLLVGIRLMTLVCLMWVQQGQAGPNPAMEAELRRDLEDLATEVLGRPDGLELRDVRMAPVYDALVRLSLQTGDPRYLAEVLRFGDQAGWQAGAAVGSPAGWNVDRVWKRIANMDTVDGHWRRQIEASRGDYDGEDAGADATGGTTSGDINAQIFLATALALEEEEAGTGNITDRVGIFQDMAQSLRSARSSDGLWSRESVPSELGKVGPLTPTAMVCLGFGIGTRLGWLNRETYLGILMETSAAIARQQVQLNRYAAWEKALLLSAGAEWLGLMAETGVEPSKVLREAERRYWADERPRARALFVPLRKDDLAWENDRIANRIYGPALRESTEDSGIDAWIKRVSYPILEKWYRMEREDGLSYHEDRGEGYDGYKVGSKRGCGGAALWMEGSLVRSNVYLRHAIYWTTPDVAEFTVWYRYPNDIEEEKTFRLRLGEKGTRIRSRYSRQGQPAGGLEVAVGLTAQTAEPGIRFDAEAGRLSLEEVLDSDSLTTFVEWPPAAQPAAAEQLLGSPKQREALVILTTDPSGEVEYEVGFEVR